MKKKRFAYPALALLLVLALSAGAVIAQSGIPREATKWLTRVDILGSSNIYPALKVQNTGTAPGIVGVPALEFIAVGTMTNGTTNTLALMDDSPSGEWAAHDADTTVAEGSATGIESIGSSSLHAMFSAEADLGDGVHDGVAYSFAADESVGMWVFCDTTLAAGDIVFDITDNPAGSAKTNFPAYYTANVWEWLEIDISAVADASKDVITDISIELSAAGASKAAAAAFNCYFDGAWKWDAVDEEALGVNLLERGVVGVIVVATAAGSGNTPSMLVEDTGYFVHYESGNDFIVTITDQSAASGLVVAAYQ